MNLTTKQALSYSPRWKLETIPDEIWYSENGRRAVAKRKTPTGGKKLGAGRPRSCECGSCDKCMAYKKRLDKRVLTNLSS